jgi:hypothetical protein
MASFQLERVLRLAAGVFDRGAERRREALGTAPEAPASRPVIRRHVMITGTGRAGTTALVQFFTALGFDTGYSLDEAMTRVDRLSKAGLEHTVIDESSPHVVKSPWLVDTIDRIMSNPAIEIECAILCIRDLHSAAESRRWVHDLAALETAEPASWAGSIWKTHDPSQQADVLARVVYDLVLGLSARPIRPVLLQFPRFVLDADYLHECLADLFERHGKSREKVMQAHWQVFDPTLIHDFHAT